MVREASLGEAASKAAATLFPSGVRLAVLS
jgi:hypothetical protein